MQILRIKQVDADKRSIIIGTIRGVIIKAPQAAGLLHNYKLYKSKNEFDLLSLYISFRRKRKIRSKSWLKNRGQLLPSFLYPTSATGI